LYSVNLADPTTKCRRSAWAAVVPGSSPGAHLSHSSAGRVAVSAAAGSAAAATEPTLEAWCTARLPAATPPPLAPLAAASEVVLSTLDGQAEAADVEAFDSSEFAVMMDVGASRLLNSNEDANLGAPALEVYICDEIGGAVTVG